MSTATLNVGTVKVPSIESFLEITSSVESIRDTRQSRDYVISQLELGLNDVTRGYIKPSLESFAPDFKLPADTDATNRLIASVEAEHDSFLETAYDAVNERHREAQVSIAHSLQELRTTLEELKTTYATRSEDTFVFRSISNCPVLNVDGMLKVFDENSWDGLLSVVRFITDLHAFVPKSIGAMISALKTPEALSKELLQKTLANAPVLDGRFTTALCEDLNTEIPALVRSDIMSDLTITQFQLELEDQASREDRVKCFPYTHCISLGLASTDAPTTDVEISKTDLIESIDHALTIVNLLVGVLDGKAPQFTKSIIADNDVFINEAMAMQFYNPITQVAARAMAILFAYRNLLSTLHVHELNEALEDISFD